MLNENIKLYQGDCLEITDKLIAEGIKVDAVITDPPYKLNKTTGSITSSSKSDKWRGNLFAGDKTANIKNDIKFQDWLPKVYEILKDDSHCYVFVNDKNIQDILNESSKVGFKLHNILVWLKNNKTPNRWYMKNCEFVVFLRKGKSIPINNLGDCQFLSSNLIEYNNINGKDKLHPTQKPTDVIEKMILNSSLEQMVIFDPFMGSGSTGIACVNTNRKFIGIELDENYFKIASDRIHKTLIEKENV